MNTGIQLIASIAIVAGLYYFHRRQIAKAHARGWIEGHTHGYREKSQLEYSRGYTDGSYEGRLKERLEWETREYKAKRNYETGYNDALAAIESQTYSVMVDAATPSLSA